MALGPYASLLYVKLALLEGSWRSLERSFPGVAPTPAMRAALERAHARLLEQRVERELQP